MSSRFRWAILLVVLLCSPALFAADLKATVRGTAIVRDDAVAVSFLVTFDQAIPAGETVTIDYETDNETAIAGTDYLPVKGSHTFTAKDSTMTVLALVPLKNNPNAHETSSFILRVTDARISGPNSVAVTNRAGTARAELRSLGARNRAAR